MVLHHLGQPVHHHPYALVNVHLKGKDIHVEATSTDMYAALDALAETLAARTATGGRIAMSGILAGQEDALLARYATWFDDLRVAREEDWVRIDGRRRG